MGLKEEKILKAVSILSCFCVCVTLQIIASPSE